MVSLSRCGILCERDGRLIDDRIAEMVVHNGWDS